MISRRPRAEDADSGAALILAIGFVLMVGTISAGLAALVTSGVNNRASLQTVRNRQYAADGAIEEAIAHVRAVPGSPLEACAVSDDWIIDTVNDIRIRVDWSNSCGAVLGSDGAAVAQRNVTFTACVDAGAPCTEADMIVAAQVNFEQASSGVVTSTYVQSWSVDR